MENLDTQAKLKGIGSRPTFICLCLVLVTAVVYWRVTGFDFIYYDDQEYFSENPHVLKGLTWQNIGWALQSTDLASWCPLTWLSFLLDVSLFGTSAVGPHFTNVFLHAANAVLLFLLLRSLTGAQWKSVLVAGLFALHPLHVESIAWVSERKDVLSAFFSLLALWCYAGYAREDEVAGTSGPGRSRVRHYLAALFFVALALLSKPMQVTLPCVLLLLDFWPLKRVGRRSWWMLIWEKLPFLILGLAVAGITIAVHRNVDALVSLDDAPLAGRIQNTFVSYARYLGKAVWPVDLILPYPYHGAWPSGVTVVAVLLFGGVSFAGIRLWRRRPFVMMGWLWFVGTLLPVAGLIRWGTQSMADRFTYFPLIGIFIAVVWLADELFVSIKTPKIISVGLSALLLVACAARTVDQISYWRNSETLFRHSLAVDPANVVADWGMGSYLTASRRLDEAVGYYQSALKINGNSPDILQGLGGTYFKMGKYEEAAQQYERALSLRPRDASTHCSLGYALVELKQLEQARNEFNESLRLNPQQATAYCGSGNLALDEGKSDEALVDYRKALEVEPANAGAHCGIANIYSQNGRLDEAISEYQLALKADPNFVEAENNLGAVLLQKGRTEEAVQCFQAVAAYQPDHLSAHVNLGNALVQQGKLDDAVKAFATALRLDSGSVEAHFGMAVALARLGRREEAVEHLNEVLRLRPQLTAAREFREKLTRPATP